MIKKIIGERGSGKTKKLLLLAQSNNAVFVCSNPSAMIEKAHSYGLRGIEVQSYEDYCFSKNTKYSRSKKYVIDDIDLFLNCFEKNVIAFSATEED